MSEDDRAVTRVAACFAACAVLLAACADEGAPEAASSDDVAVDSAAIGADTTAATTRFVPRDSIVFAFRVSEYEQVYFEPIYLLDGDSAASATLEQGTPEGDAFEARWYTPGSRYHASSGGVPAGEVELDGAALAGCTGMPGDASFVEKVPAAPMRGLAFARPHPAARFVVEPTAEEDRATRDAALERLRGTGVPEEKLAEAVWDPVVAVVTPDGARTLMTAVELSAFDDAEVPAMAFVMLESTPAGMRVVDARARDGRLLDEPRPEFVDAADLDGDGTPEIVLNNVYYESWDYTILRRSRGRWEPVFRGGASGC